jgi:alkylhydroperoxidase/carboxymuconolactone decarboxylase family protein YurZ
MRKEGKPPRVHQAFVTRFPELGRAWDLAREAGQSGPLDEKTVHLVKLGVAFGALREGAVHSSVRKALAAGVSADEIHQAIALASTTIGFPAGVAVYSWVADVLARGCGRRRTR